MADRLPNGQRRAATHRCPGCERPGVPNRLFACRGCWAALPRDIQREIVATARLSLLEPRRAAAVSDAVEWYAARAAEREQAGGDRG